MASSADREAFKREVLVRLTVEYLVSRRGKMGEGSETEKTVRELVQEWGRLADIAADVLFPGKV